jgi:hypothetical protein
VGNEGMWVVGITGSWDKISFLLFCATSLLSLPSLGIPLLDGVYSQLRGDPLLSVMSNVVYGWDSCVCCIYCMCRLIVISALICYLYVE